MYNLIPPIIVILSLGGILIIFLRKIVAVSKNIDNSPEEADKNNRIGMTKNIETADNKEPRDKSDSEISKELGVKSLYEKISSRLRFKEMMYSILQFLEKTLRRTKVNLMKIENIAASLTKKLSEKSKNLAVNKTEETSEKDNNAEAPVITENNVQDDKEKKESPESSQAKPEKSLELTKEFVEQEKEFIYRIAKNHADIESYLALGKLYMGVKNYDDAKQSFEHALKIDPDNRKAKAGIKKIEKFTNNNKLWG